MLQALPAAVEADGVAALFLPQSNCVIFHQKKALECVLCFRGTFSCTNTLRGFIGFILHFPGCLYRPGTNVFGFLL